jgi:hypothetical protein
MTAAATVLLTATAASASSGTPTPPSAVAPSNKAIIFIHGTADWAPSGVSGTAYDYTSMTCSAPAQCSFDPSAGGAAANYWEQGSINQMANGSPYLVVNYYGVSQDQNTSWGTIVDQIATYVQYYSNINELVLVTHSDGVNPVRYAIAHDTAPSPTGSGNTWSSVVEPKLYGELFIAGSQQGTPLATALEDLQSIPVISDIVDVTGYAGPATWEQAEAQALTNDSNGTWATTSNYEHLDGAWVLNFAGQGTSYSVFGGQCDSYWEAFGLWAASALVGWNNYGNNPTGNTDGFIGQGSATYIGFQSLTSGNQQNHNQSRRSCGGVGPGTSPMVQWLFTNQ